ncbi:hypothetical protein RYZ90_18710 [Citrobacter portucalensis]|uniref:Uncharacterized protein n=1 Tax=Citrobacter portucalensis TaxID=1639133 RepID=A0ABD5H488_9ENTR|nr:hypothetical protein [Citrobacter portucalensis]MDW2635881.1 hypothetical protein [Citrobacter portucalensis]DAH60039.1 MAG TPA: shock protein B [Caudoviricetes sp.]
MELTFSVITILLVLLVMSAWRAASYLKKISESNELAVRCLDAHELLLRKMQKEQERQGADIETIKDIAADRK